MTLLLSVYIGATVFGVGVTLVDLFGLLGSHDGDHDATAGPTGGHVGDDTASGVGGHDGGDHIPGHHDGAESVEHDGSVAGHDRPDRRNPLLGLLAFLRNVIYFCLGFGPVGWFALATSGSVVTALVWSIPVGGAALIGTRVLRRFMRRELNSEISTGELLMERGVVTVSIGSGELGKVRVRLGDLYVERYARAATSGTEIRVGTRVRITDVSDDCVYVDVEAE